MNNTAEELDMQDGEECPTTTGVAMALDSGDSETLQMILGNRYRIKPAGIVRCGIKTTLQSCTQEQVAKYKAMLEEGFGFEEIDKQLVLMRPSTTDGRQARSWLRPSNVNYFSVRSKDFGNPADAEKLLKLYADPDGKLRRFPIWFGKGEFDLIIPHGYIGFGGGGAYVRYQSFYKGNRLFCRYVPDSVKIPGKNDYLERPCPGLEDAGSCPDCKAKRCRFGGRMVGAVPGVSGIGEVLVSTNSWHGLGESVANLRRVREVFGRFHGLFQKKPYLEVAKVERQVRHEGKTSTQYIPIIQPCVDMLELAAANDPDEAAARAVAAMSLLSGRAPAPSRPVIVPAPFVPHEPAPSESQAPEASTRELQPLAPAPGEVTPEVEKAVAAIKGLCANKAIDFPWSGISAWMTFEFGLPIPEAGSVDQLRKIYGVIQEKYKAGKDSMDEFRSVLSDCERGVSDGPTDEGFEGFQE